MRKTALLSDKTYQTIKYDIVTCALEPGQQIAQADLASRYRVGMTPVREALRQLAQEGFVNPIPRLGYIVSVITSDDVHEIYETRSILEAATVRLASLRGTEERLRQITAAANFTYKYKNRQSYAEFLDQNKQFHLSIAQATENRRLTELVTRTLDELTRVFHLGLDLRDSAKEMRDDHCALAQAIQKRDADLAVQLVQGEIARSQERVLEALAHIPHRSLTTQGTLELGRRRFHA
ncbi:MAG: GntR family transcriptional regulator [Chloroflexi bacterium]|nr:GntR family transcriptional regulator [Chloroflexota bacterium]